MIRYLHISHLVLIEECLLELGPGLNIFTGETGSGKTALTQALSYLCGARADSSAIRSGADRALIEGAFEFPSFDLESISHTGDELLILKRELIRDGKNRAWINGHLVPLSTLQKVGTLLIDQVGQSAHYHLRETDAQRELLDLFSSSPLVPFQKAYEAQKICENTLLNLKAKKERSEQQLLHLRSQIEEIEKAQVKAGEEEALYAEYQKLAHFQELAGSLQTVHGTLSEPINPLLARSKQLLSSAANHDPSLKEPAELLSQALLELQETALTLSRYLENLQADPGRFSYLEERLKTLDHLKRKYGSDPLPALKAELSGLENLSEEIETYTAQLASLDAKTQQLATALSSSRKTGAAKWESLITQQLHSLNMPQAKFIIELRSDNRTQFGDETIHFWLAPNTGEPQALVKECASGGELSRLLFAIKITLADKNATPTLIFDEIDSNVGGTTATLLAEKLSQLGKIRQLLCITHFPQVAKRADDHFCVTKEEKEGRTQTQVRRLAITERERELVRMSGYFDNSKELTKAL